jgi:hypothetical protein
LPGGSLPGGTGTNTGSTGVGETQNNVQYFGTPTNLSAYRNDNNGLLRRLVVVELLGFLLVPPLLLKLWRSRGSGRT